MARRLAAILAADVVGYSSLMNDDETGTLAALKAHRAEVFDPVIAERGGRLVKLMGDGALVEFPSVVEAVEAALAIQQQVAAGDGPIRLRIGINLGDVIIDGDDIYGDGVNVAARLEALAEPGGVCISSVVHESIGNRVEAEFGDAGEHEVKGIDRPIRVWQWPATDAAHAPLALPEKPSVAILPFINMSGDPEQEYFADGLTDEIGTVLAKIEKLFVIAQSSTRAYKSRDVDVRQVGREQGVRYVLQGSVRRAGDRIRVTARLTDCSTGFEIWADRYQNELADFFDIQDEITREVAVALQVALTDGEQAKIWASGTKSIDAWDLTIRGGELVNHHRREDTERARLLLERAIELDPNYVDAWCKLGWCHWSDARHGWSPSPEQSLSRAREIGEHAAALDKVASEPWSLLALTAVQEGLGDEAADYADNAVARAAGHSFVLGISGMVLGFCGRPAEAVKLMKRAMRLSPICPDWYRMCLARSCFLSGDAEGAIRELIDAPPMLDGVFVFPVILVASLYEMGRSDEARAICATALKEEPDFTIEAWLRPQMYKNDQDQQRIVSALEALGLPKP